MQSEWMVNGRMVWFAYGNLSSQRAVGIAESARKTLNIKALSKDELPPIRCITLDEGKSYRLDFPVEDVKNDNSCFIAYY